MTEQRQCKRQGTEPGGQVRKRRGEGIEHVVGASDDFQ